VPALLLLLLSCKFKRTRHMLATRSKISNKKTFPTY